MQVESTRSSRFQASERPEGSTSTSYLTQWSAAASSLCSNFKLFRGVECNFLTALTVADFKQFKSCDFAELMLVLKSAQFTLSHSTKLPLLACRSEISNIGEPNRC